MRNIVMIDIMSTGYNYVLDILRRGYRPVVILPDFSNQSEAKYIVEEGRKAAIAKVPADTKILQAGKNYEETLAIVRELDPVLVLAASETGVELAARLAWDLGLPCNSYKNIDRYVKKSAMHQALQDHGVRSIRGKIIRSFAEAEQFMNEIGTQKVVVKPTRSAGSYGLRLCSSKEEVKAAIEYVSTHANYMGQRVEEILIQERIFGTEYIVNTMSRHGKHKVTSIWKYHKLETGTGGYVYNSCESVNELEVGHSELIEYSYAVLDALEVSDGPVHGEYMVDEKGPVLIEVNCRPMGGNMSAEWADLVFGQHETDTILDSFLDEQYFERILKEPYHALRKGVMKFIINPTEMEIFAAPIRVLLDHLRSVYSYQIVDVEETGRLMKTENHESTGGHIYLVHDDPQVVQQECDLLHLSEERYFEMLYTSKDMSRSPIPEKIGTLDQVIDVYSPTGAILAVSDRSTEKHYVTRILPEDVSKVKGGFDLVIYDMADYGEGPSVEQTLDWIFKAMEKVKHGGRFVFTRRFYAKTPYGRPMSDAFLIFGGFRIEAPIYGSGGNAAGIRD